MSNIKITQAAIAMEAKALFRKQPIEKVSVTMICDQVGIDRKTFYRYFKDKFDVIDWIYYHDFFADMEPQEDWNIWDYFTEIQRQIFSDREFYLNAFRYQGQNSFRDYGKELLMPIVHKEYGDVFNDPEFEAFIAGNAFNLTCDACERLLSGKITDQEEFTRQFKTFFMLFSERNAAMLKDNLERSEKA